MKLRKTSAPIPELDWSSGEQCVAGLITYMLIRADGRYMAMRCCASLLTSDVGRRFVAADLWALRKLLRADPARRGAPPAPGAAAPDAA